MKKSILALGAVAVIGGLGLATSAQAVVALGVAGNTASTAVGLELNPGSTGHELIVPYYSAQGATNTLLSIVNTDQKNGKAVKVRFRGAANSDDVLDFTLFLSPADVWTASVTQDANGLAHLTSSDKSCTLPAGPIDQAFLTNRLTGLTASQQAANTREGYIEILNMADIPPTTGTGKLGTGGAGTTATDATNYLYTAIKHVNGVPPCAATWGANTSSKVAGKDAIIQIYNTDVESGSNLLGDYGLDAPSGGLAGSWALINQQTLAQFSSDDVAVRAYATPASGISTGTTGIAQVVFSPQLQSAYAGTVANVTADPLLTGALYYQPVNGQAAGSPALSANYYDLPDLSTPLLSATVAQPNVSQSGASVSTPTGEADLLANALGKTSFSNEFVNNPTGTVPLSTDWVISQPTRRYFAAVDYTGGATAASIGTGAIIYNDGYTSAGGETPGATPLATGAGATTAGLPYAGNLGRIVSTAIGSNSTPGVQSFAVGTQILKLVQTAYGPQACLVGASFTPYDREEAITAPTGPSFSPGLAAAVTPFCGEVATVTWGTSPLGAALTNVAAATQYQAGWGLFQVPAGVGVAGGAVNITGNGVGGSGPTYGLPLLGFSAESGGNLESGVSYGATLGHRW